MKMHKPILRMESITKKFFGTTVLNNVNIDLNKGEILALVGENGAGKSTLMKILTGVYPKGEYKGKIIIDGIEQNFQNKKDSEKAGIEMIYQEIHLHLDLTVAENIFLGRLPRDRFGFVYWKRVFEEATVALNMVGLDVDVKKKVRNLSTSQQQLIVIAKALIRRPKILVLDEPSSALTEKETDNLLMLLKKLKKEDNLTSIYISHKINEVFEIADRITVLRDGKSINTYDASQVTDRQIVEDMVGRKIENMFPKEEVPFGEVALEIEGLTVPHPLNNKKDILKNISFRVHKGEILGLAGLVGSGRSELVNAVFGAVEPRNNPNIYVEGKQVEIKQPTDAIKYGIGLMTEDRKKSGYVGTLNLRENISLASLSNINRNGFVESRREIDNVKNIMEKLNIKANNSEDNILSLSGGNQQKVVLGKWLMRNVKILILDEPTRGIDVGAKVEIYKLMTELAKRNIAIIMISSELPELLSMCDRFLVLANGEIKDEFLQKDATQERIMHAATNLS